MVVLLGVLVVALVAGAAFVVIRRVAVDRAIEDARQLTLFSADVVEQRVSDGIVTGDAAATGQVATVIGDAVLHDPVVHVKLWSQDGTILYSDELKAIGKKFESGASELDELSPGQTSAEISDLSAPENQYEQGSGPLLEVYTPIETPDGTPLLFETYQRYSSIDEQRQQLLRDFAPVLIVALIALAVLLIPLGWILARRLQRVGREREEALQRSLDMSDRERRRIAGDLHDGPVQELAGLSMRLSASAEHAADPTQRGAARVGDGGARQCAHAPVGDRGRVSAEPRGERARSRARGPHVPAPAGGARGLARRRGSGRLRLGRRSAALPRLPRGAAQRREARRRVPRDHPGRSRRIVCGARGRRRRSRDRRRAVPDEGHLGLQIVDDLVRDAGGTLSVTPGAQGGTVVRVEVPTS